MPQLPESVSELIASFGDLIPGVSHQRQEVNPHPQNRCPSRPRISRALKSPQLSVTNSLKPSRARFKSTDENFCTPAIIGRQATATCSPAGKACLSCRSEEQHAMPAFSAVFYCFNLTACLLCYCDAKFRARNSRWSNSRRFFDANF